MMSNHFGKGSSRGATVLSRWRQHIGTEVDSKGG